MTVSKTYRLSRCEKDVLVKTNPDAREEVGESPNAGDRGSKRFMADSLPVNRRDERMNSNREDEESTAHIAGMQQPSLCETRRRRSEDRIESYPVPADQECGALLQVRNQQIKNQEDVLVVADEGSIVQFPGYQPVDNE